MTDSWGIDDSYFEISGAVRERPPAVCNRLMEAMGVAPGDHLPQVPLRFVGPGRTRRLDGHGTVELEDGSRRAVQGELPDDLPIGYHLLHMEGGDEPIRLFV